MKNLDLNGFGVHEMNAEEMNGINGGIFLEIAVGITVGLVISFCDNFGEFVAGYKLQPLKK